MSMKSVELRQEKVTLYDQATKLLNAAKDREMTIDEKTEYGGINLRMDAVGHEILQLEADEAREAEVVALAHGGAVGGLPTVNSIFGDLAAPVPEIEQGHVLAPNRSVQRFMETRGLIRQPEYKELTIGAFLRSMVTGAKTDLEKRALAEGTDSAGGYSVPDIVLSRFIDRLRAATVTIRAGAKTVPLTSDKTTIARIATDPAAGWRLENAAVDIVDNTYEGVVFIPRSLAVMVKVSRELVEDSVNIEDMLTAALLGGLSRELDRVALIGTGTPPEPRGISTTTNVGSVAAAGALANYDKIIDAMYECWVDNSPVVNVAIMHPRTLATLAKLKETTTNAPLEKPEVLRAVPFMQTTSLSITEAPGTASRIILGDFSKLMIGIRTQLRIEVLRELYAANLQYGFLAHLRADIGLEHPESFAMVTGITP